MLAYMRMVPLICGLAATGALIASDAYPPPQFTDPQRVKKLEAAMPEVDRILHSYATEKKIPGMVWGVVIDGRLAHTGTPEGRLHFAGEHTSPWPGWIQGALHSGLHNESCRGNCDYRPSKGPCWDCYQ